MGPENKDTGMTCYIDGQPVNMEQIPEITVTSPAPVSVADLAASLEPVLEWIADIVKQAVTALTKLWDAIVVQARAAEFRRALRWAEVSNRQLANRYYHAKKKRTREKYAKLILAWYRAEVVGP